jgi:hypothetical protein
LGQDRLTSGRPGRSAAGAGPTDGAFGRRDSIGAHEKTGEVFTNTWSLYRDKLTLGPVEGAVSPENFSAKPWTRVD